MIGKDEASSEEMRTAENSQMKPFIKNWMLYTENRRMRWMMQAAIDPSDNNYSGRTLWEAYKEIDEEFWRTQGL